jgi:hypothetical protein
MTILRTWKKGEKIQHELLPISLRVRYFIAAHKLLNLKTSEIHIVQAGRGLSFAAEILTSFKCPFY